MALSLFSNRAFAVKHSLEFQTGAMLGAAHISYGITFAEKHTLAIGFGYVPKVSYHDEMTLTSLKYRYESGWRYPFTFMGHNLEFSPLSVGITTITGHDDEIYSELPEGIPDGYYFPTARRILFNYQATVKLHYKMEAYMDWSILDVGLINYARNFDFYRDNYDFFGLEGIVTYGFGFRKTF